jgi:hypothetical protein
MMGEVVIRPYSGEFDVDEIRAHLERLPTAIPDPQRYGLERFLLSSSSEGLEHARDLRLRGESIPYSVTVLRLSPSSILLGQRSSDTEPARAFTEWLRSRYRLRFLDEAHNEFAVEGDDGPDQLFGPRS